MARRIDIDPDNLDADQKRVHDAIKAGPRGIVEGPLKVWLRSPALAARAQELGAFCRYKTSLPGRLTELAILITGAYWKAGFEWHVHAPIAIAAGLDPVAVEALRRGRAATFARADEQAIHDFCAELLETKSVSDPVYASALRAVGETGLVELVGVLGYYALISMTIKAFDVAIPDGAKAPFEDVTS